MQKQEKKIIKIGDPREDLRSTGSHLSSADNRLVHDEADDNIGRRLEGKLPRPVIGMVNKEFSLICTLPDKTPAVKCWKQFQTTLPTPDELLDMADSTHSSWAIVTGKVSGVIVLDFDGDDAEKLVEEIGLSPHVRTGSGGYHIYIKHPGWWIKTVSGLGIYPNLDVRGDGGYAIFHGSSISGEYKWLMDDIEPYDFDMLPEHIQYLLSPASDTAQEVTSNGEQDNIHRVAEAKLLHDALTKVDNGEGRNDSGFWLACQLRDNGYSQDEAIQVLDDYASSVPPHNVKGVFEAYTNGDARASLAQAYSEPAREPWSVGDGERCDTRRNRKTSDLFVMEAIEDFLNKPVPDVKYIVDRLIAHGGLHLLAGDAKSGKTTYTTAMIGRITNQQPFHGLETSRVRVGWLGLQELERDLQERFRRFGVVDTYVYTGHVRDFDDRYRALTNSIRAYKLKLVVIDTLANFMQVDDENDAAKVGREMERLRQVAADTGCAIWLIHHTRKAGGRHGLGVRGSNNIIAEADNVIVFSRRNDERELDVMGRWELFKQRIKLVGDNYLSLGSSESADQESRKQIILDALDDCDGLSKKGIHQAVSGERSVSFSTISRDIDALVDSGHLKREGKGDAHYPYLYCLDTSHKSEEDV